MNDATERKKMNEQEHNNIEEEESGNLTLIEIVRMMDYLRAVRGKEIVCTANVIKTGKTLTWVEGTISDDTGREVAKTKFIYYRLKESRHFGFESIEE